MFRRYWRHPLPYLVAALMTLIYINLPSIINWVILHPSFRNFAYQDIRIICNSIQKYFVFPFGHYLYYGQRMLFVFPYWVLIMILARVIYLHSQFIWKYLLGLSLLVFLFLFFFPNSLLQLESQTASESIGHVQNGSIENSKRMPYKGSNFTSYSFGAYLLGRTFVHEKIRTILLESYQECEETCPNRIFVLGELGLRKGGLFIPHTAHQNGLSVDFMVPLLKSGVVYQSHSVFNLWGYAHNFDTVGKNGEIEIDFEAMAQHLIALNNATIKNGMVIQKIIFSPTLVQHLLTTKQGELLNNLPFGVEQQVVRHHNHYHIDFGQKR